MPWRKQGQREAGSLICNDTDRPTIQQIVDAYANFSFSAAEIDLTPTDVTVNARPPGPFPYAVASDFGASIDFQAEGANGFLAPLSVGAGRTAVISISYTVTGCSRNFWMWVQGRAHTEGR